MICLGPSQEDLAFLGPPLLATDTRHSLKGFVPRGLPLDSWVGRWNGVFSDAGVGPHSGNLQSKHQNHWAGLIGEFSNLLFYNYIFQHYHFRKEFFSAKIQNEIIARIDISFL